MFSRFVRRAWVFFRELSKLGKILFQNSDAWIFLSVAIWQRDEGVALRDIISSADYINHDIPSSEEIEGAVDRLACAGLLTITGDRVALSGSGKETLSRVAARTAYLHEQMKILEHLLTETDIRVLHSSSWGLTEEQFHSALRAYQNESPANASPDRERESA